MDAVDESNDGEKPAVSSKKQKKKSKDKRAKKKAKKSERKKRATVEALHETKDVSGTPAVNKRKAPEITRIEEYGYSCLITLFFCPFSPLVTAQIV